MSSQDGLQYEPDSLAPISKDAALHEVRVRNLHPMVVADVHETDEPLHWHEFATLSWVLSGAGAVANATGEVFYLRPGGLLVLPAGCLHRTLAGTDVRLVIGTDLPQSAWTRPINKDPRELPA